LEFQFESAETKLFEFLLNLPIILPIIPTRLCTQNCFQSPASVLHSLAHLNPGKDSEYAALQNPVPIVSLRGLTAELGDGQDGRQKRLIST